LLHPENDTMNKNYVSTTHLHLVSEEEIDQSKLISLNSMQNKTFNNLCIINNIAPSYAKKNQLISLSIIGKNNSENLEKKLQQELSNWIPSADKWKILDHNIIEYALPNQRSVSNKSSITKQGNIWLSGDYLTNGSINAAIKNGKMISEAVGNIYE